MLIILTYKPSDHSLRIDINIKLSSPSTSRNFFLWTCFGPSSFSGIHFSRRISPLWPSIPSLPCHLPQYWCCAPSVYQSGSSLNGSCVLFQLYVLKTRGFSYAKTTGVGQQSHLQYLVKLVDKDLLDNLLITQ